MAKKSLDRARRLKAMRRRQGRGPTRPAIRRGQRRGRVQRPAAVVVTAADVAARLSDTIARQTAVLIRRLKQNSRGISEAAIMDAMGDKAAKFTTLLDTASAFVAMPAQPPAQ